VVSWQAEVNAVLPPLQAHRHELEEKIVSSDLFRATLRLIAGIFQGKQIGGVVGIGATAALIGGLGGCRGVLPIARAALSRLPRGLQLDHA
jgi:hypothetical protein